MSLSTKVLRDELSQLVAATFRSHQQQQSVGNQWLAAASIFQRGLTGGLPPADLEMIGRMLVNRVVFPTEAWQVAASIFSSVKTVDGLNGIAKRQLFVVLRGRGGLWELSLGAYQATAASSNRNFSPLMRRVVSRSLMQHDNQWCRSVEMLKHDLFHRDEPHVASAGHVMKHLALHGQWQACLRAYAVLVHVVHERVADKERWAGVFGLALDAVSNAPTNPALRQEMLRQMVEYGKRKLGERFALDARGHSATSTTSEANTSAISVTAAETASQNNNGVPEDVVNCSAVRLIRGYAAHGNWLEALNLLSASGPGIRDDAKLREHVLRSSEDPKVIRRIVEVLSPLTKDETNIVTIWLRGSSNWELAAKLIATSIVRHGEVSRSSGPDHSAWLLAVSSNLVGGMQVPWAVARHCLQLNRRSLSHPTNTPRLLIGVAESLLRDGTEDFRPEALKLIDVATTRYKGTLPSTCLALLRWDEIPVAAVAFAPAYHLLTTTAAEKTCWEKAFFLCSCLAGRRPLARTGPFVGPMLRGLPKWPAPPRQLMCAAANLVDTELFDVDDDAAVATAVETAALLVRSGHYEHALTLAEVLLPRGGSHRRFPPRALFRLDELMSMLFPTAGSGSDGDLCTLEDDQVSTLIRVVLHFMACFLDSSSSPFLESTSSQASSSSSSSSSSFKGPYAGVVLTCVKALCRIHLMTTERDVPAVWEAALRLAAVDPVSGTRRGGALLTMCLSILGPGQWREAVRCISGMRDYCDVKHCSQFGLVHGVHRLEQHLGKVWPEHCQMAREVLKYRKGQ